MIDQGVIFLWRGFRDLFGLWVKWEDVIGYAGLGGGGFSYGWNVAVVDGDGDRDVGVGEGFEDVRVSVDDGLATWESGKRLLAAVP